VHVIPHVTVVKSGDVEVNNESHRALLLKVTNPTLGSIRLRLAASSYRGETSWDDDAESVQLPELLVDTWSQTIVDAVLAPDLSEGLEPTATAELLSAEDSIIEMGVKTREVPEDVANWDGASCMASSASHVGGASSLRSSVRLLAHSASSSWFELTLLGIPKKHQRDDASAGTATAVPLALQIEVGNGSWESSLIQSQITKGHGEPDRVIFDLILIIAT